MPEPVAPLLVWVDAQLPSALSRSIEVPGHIKAVHVSEIGLLTAGDPEIFARARSAGAIVMTKDADFVQLQERCGPPPQLLWVTCGNIGNAKLDVLIRSHWQRAIELLRAGEPLVEINAGRANR